MAGGNRRLICSLRIWDLAGIADSGDCGRGFRLNATIQSDRRRPPVSTEAAGWRCRHEDWGQIFLVGSSLARCAVIFRMLSPLIASAMVGSAMTSCQFSIDTWLVMMVDPRWR